MRQLPGVILLLLIAAGCKKDTTEAPFYSATFSRTVNGGDPWTWSFTNMTGGAINFTQTFYTGALTGGKQTRWHLFLSDPPNHGSFDLSFPGIDSSASLPVGKEFLVSSRITQPDPIGVAVTLMDKGAVYTGTDSAFLDVQLDAFDGKIITGTFSCRLYSQGAAVAITGGHLTRIPVTLAGR